MNRGALVRQRPSNSLTLQIDLGITNLRPAVERMLEDAAAAARRGEGEYQSYDAVLSEEG